MKIRRGFVTNSSSSSYICVAKVDKTQELLDYFKEEYGKYGLKVLDKYLVPGQKILDNRWDYDEFKTYCEDNDITIVPTDLYLQAEFYTWTTEGDENGDDAWLWDKIPSKYMEQIYEGDSD